MIYSSILPRLQAINQLPDCCELSPFYRLEVQDWAWRFNHFISMMISCKFEMSEMHGVRLTFDRSTASSANGCRRTHLLKTLVDKYMEVEAVTAHQDIDCACTVYWLRDQNSPFFTISPCNQKHKRNKGTRKPTPYASSSLSMSPLIENLSDRFETHLSPTSSISSIQAQPQIFRRKIITHKTTRLLPTNDILNVQARPKISSLKAVS